MSPKGSIVLKILIVLLALALWQIISIPSKIWKQEAQVLEASRANMTAVYEAQSFYYSSYSTYVPSDSMDKLIAHIAEDTSLNKRRRIGQLTQQLNNLLQDVTDVPVVNALLPVLSAIEEIEGDLAFNTRYFEKYDGVTTDGPDLMSQKESIARDIDQFNSGVDYPNYAIARQYLDSLTILKDELNDFVLQEAALRAERYVDTLAVYIPEIEFDELAQFWADEYDKVIAFTRDIKTTPIVNVSSVGDRLQKFIDRIRAANVDLKAADVSGSIAMLGDKRAELDRIYTEYTSEENQPYTSNRALTQLSETDSILIKLTPDQFFDPDTFDGSHRYIIAYDSGSSVLVVEDPNLLGMFNEKLTASLAPLSDLSIYEKLAAVQDAIDSAAFVMDDNKTRYRFSRYSTDLILGVKELDAEMKDLRNNKFYRYTANMKTFVDTVRTERRLSVLKPMIESLLNPMDTLATRLETGNMEDFEERIAYFEGRIRQLDSLVQAELPARLARNVDSFTDTYQMVVDATRELKSAINAADGAKLRDASDQIAADLTELLNGYHEPVAVVFYRKHINHGHIENDVKSWEVEE